MLLRPEHPGDINKNKEYVLNLFKIRISSLSVVGLFKVTQNSFWSARELAL